MQDQVAAKGISLYRKVDVTLLLKMLLNIVQNNGMISRKLLDSNDNYTIDI